MIKLFYISGDSFAFGQELGPEDKFSLYNFTPYKRKHCYSGIMADDLEIEDYQNSGCPGGSNERAYRCLVSDITVKLKKYKPEEIFVNISLTHASRREFCLTPTGHYYPHLTTWKPINGSYPETIDLWEILTRHFNHDYGHYMFDFLMVLGMQNFLKIHRIPYLFTSSMGNSHEYLIQKQYITPQFEDQLDKRRYMISPSFSSYCQSLKCKFGPGAHPLEEGHALWAKYLIDYITSNNLLSNDL